MQLIVSSPTIVHNMKTYRADDYCFCKYHEFLRNWPTIKEPTKEEIAKFQKAVSHSQLCSEEWRAWRHRRDNLKEGQYAFVIDGTNILLPDVRLKDCIMVIYYWHNGDIKSKIINILYEGKSNASFLQTALIIAFGFSPEGCQTINFTQEYKEITDVFIWSDNGQPYKCKTLLLLLSYIKHVIPNVNFEWSYYGPYHGKSSADAHAGVIKRKLRDWKKAGICNAVCFSY